MNEAAKVSAVTRVLLDFILTFIYGWMPFNDHVSLKREYQEIAVNLESRQSARARARACVRARKVIYLTIQYILVLKQNIGSLKDVRETGFWQK